MAQLNSLIVTGNSRFINPINGNARNGVYFVKGTQTAATGAWTGVIPIPALYDGLTIMYYLPYAGSGNATLNLTLSTGATTGAINCYYSTSRLTTHYAKGCNIVMTYHSAGSISVDGTATTDDRWIANANYDTNSNTIGEYAGSVTAGGGNMARYSLIMQTQLDPPTFASLVTTSSTATTKDKQTCGFIPNGKVLYQSASTYDVGDTAGQSGVWVTASLDLRYSFNITTTTFSATDVGKSIYIKCTLNSTDGKLYLADTTWWATELPTTQDNFYYVFVGQLYSRYQCTLYPLHPIYYHNGTEITEYSPRIEEIVSDKMDKVNPTGSGSFSLNRKADTTIGLYSTTEGNENTASGAYSHAEGHSNTASGGSSHAEGAYNTASAGYAHAEGNETTASGIAAHAEGYQATASATGAHAEGQGTKASSAFQHVFGKYNIEDTADTYAEIVGKGSSRTPSNARTLDWSGNEVLSGTIEATGFGTTLLNLIYPVGSIYMSVNNVNPGTYLTGTTWVAWGAGRVPVGVDATQTEFDTVEETGGEKTHLLTGDESGTGSHYHDIPSLSGTAATTTNLTGDAYFHAGEVASILYNCSGVFSNSYGGSTTQYRTPGDLTARSGAASKGIIHFAGNHSHTVTTNSSITSEAYADAYDAHNNLQPYITCYMWKRTA